MKTLKLEDILKKNPNQTWIETSTKTYKKGKWGETKLESFTGISKIKFGVDCLSYSYVDGLKNFIMIAEKKLVKARVRIWNKETKENELYKIIF